MNYCAYFDKIASAYNLFSGILIRHKKFADKIKILSKYKSNFKVLDVGGGTGLVAQFFSGSKEIIVLDPSQKMLDKIDKINEINEINKMNEKDKIKVSKIKKVLGMAQKMPFNNNYFDLVYCVDSFHHFVNGVNKKDYEKTFDICIKELLRVLKKKGILIIVDFDIGKRGILIKFIPFVENKLMRWGSKFFTREEMKKLFLKHNVNAEIYDIDKLTYAAKITKI